MKNKRCLLFLLLLLSFFIHPRSSLAGDSALNFMAGYGEFTSTVYELSFQHYFDPWLEGDGIALSPMGDVAASAWDRSDRTTWGGALGLGFSLDFFTANGQHPFITLVTGPIWISNKYYARLNLGSKVLFRNKISFGLLLEGDYKRSLSLEVVHYSNANTNKSNPGYNEIGLAYGVRF